MRRRKVRHLPALFEKIEARGGIDQLNGSIPAKPGVLDRSRASNRVRRARKMCGFCFGAHIADIAGVPPIATARSSMTLRRHIYHYTTLRVNALSHRRFDQGIAVLAHALENGADFKAWDSRQARIYPTTPETRIANYLRERCGAPDCCFSGNAWPDDVKPSAVLRRMIELNPGIADKALAR